MLSANQIHKQYITDGTSFQKWIVWEKHKYEQRQPKGEFIVWLNRKYNLLRDRAWNNVDCEEKQNFWDTLSDLSNERGEQPKKILGMKPILFYGLIFTVLLGATVMVVDVINKNK